MMTYEMALQRLSALCASAEHCEYEMTEKMRKWEVEESDCERIMEYLRKAKFVDDERYARAFVKDKINTTSGAGARWSKDYGQSTLPRTSVNECSTRLTRVSISRCSPTC